MNKTLLATFRNFFVSGSNFNQADYRALHDKKSTWQQRRHFHKVDNYRVIFVVVFSFRI
jgi:hypothetical protein